MTPRAKMIAARPLPRPIRVYKDETTPSFIRRLETANSLEPRQLRTLLKSSRRPWIDSLAAWTDYDPAVLILAMPQLGQHDPAPSLRRKLTGRPIRTTHTAACHRCALARGAGRYVDVYSTHEHVICPRHGLWIGDGVTGFSDQFSIHAGPEITAAWHHHKNLITRHGRSGVRKAFHIASVINWRWYDQFQHFTATTEIYDELAADQPGHSNSQAVVAASLYPAIVALTAAISSPHWAEIAHSHRPDRFLDRISIEVTEGWSPSGALDPLRHWMATDWLPGFRGSDAIRPSTPR
ncbi:TniQ family protein [Micrococcaceae bacterium Sec5.7]